MKLETSYWQTIDATGFRPDYIDSSGNDLRSYGASVVVEDQAERYALLPDARYLPFIKYFALFFLPLFGVIAVAFIPGPEKWIVAAGGPICGGAVFSLIYFLLAREIKRGPYFEFYPREDVVRLPRYGVECHRDTIECLQWITGGSKYHAMGRATDVNLIIRNKDGGKQRYFVLGSPSRKLAVAIAEKIKIPVTEITLRSREKRDEDAKSAK